MIRALAACIAAGALYAATAHGEEAPLRLIESEIKAALIYNFLKYTDWPDANGGALVVCEIGGDPGASRLSEMTGRTVRGHVIAVRAAHNEADTGACALAFIDAAAQQQWPKLKAALAGHALLTVGDFKGFAASGGMIEFSRGDDRIEVLINTQAVAASHLVVEDRLLRLASVVRSP